MRHSGVAMRTRSAAVVARWSWAIESAKTWPSTSSELVSRFHAQQQPRPASTPA